MIWLCILATIYVMDYTLKVLCYITYIDNKKPVYIRLRDCEYSDDYDNDVNDNDDLPASVKALYT